jgi:diaminohydroxyphosphoribosylaminopyrimidine deaminase/5-amino-6-(5-phosphoribosylamino)uracil reductase
MFSTQQAGPIVIVTTEAAVEFSSDHAEALESLGVRLLIAPTHDLTSALTVLSNEGITSLLLEGGPTLHRAAWEAEVVDRVRIYVSPTEFGRRGVRWFRARSTVVESLDELDVRMVGPDECTDGYVHRID